MLLIRLQVNMHDNKKEKKMKMKDKDFLIWIHDRLEHKYKESPKLDYMYRLRSIIDNTHEDQVSVVVLDCGKDA